MRPVTATAILVMVTVVLSGCTAEPDPAPSALIGLTVEAAAEQVPPGRSYAWYDLTQDILHKDGDLIGGDDPDQEDGVIIAVCANAKTIGSSSRISAGAIPESAYHGAIKRKAEDGEFQTLLPECQPK